MEAKEAKETVEDIVASLRDGSIYDENGCFDSKEIADRIEAAWKRESKAIATENAVLPAVCITKSVGNAAAMREALEAVSKAFDDALICEDSFMTYEEKKRLDEIYHKVKDAISAPPRNCDVGTADEQAQRYDEFCAKTNCAKCPVQAMWGIYFGVVKNEKVSCGLIWAQMPYEAEEGEAK